MPVAETGKKILRQKIFLKITYEYLPDWNF